MKRLKIPQKLWKKYDNTFNFFLVKPINQMIYDQKTKISNIIFKDITIVIDINEYLKRYYFIFNSSSRNEIVERIRLLTQFYERNLLMRYEYPMMIITKTKNIFMKRFRKLKKMTAMQISSDQSSSEESVQEYIQVDSSNIIKDMSIEQSFNTYQKHNHKQVKQMDYDEQIHDIFLQKTEKQRKFSMFPFNLNISQEEVRSLVLDFDEVDLESAINQYKKAQTIINKKQKQQEDNKKQSKTYKIKVPTVVITPVIQQNSLKTNIGSPQRKIEDLHKKKNSYPILNRQDLVGFNGVDFKRRKDTQQLVFEMPKKQGLIIKKSPTNVYENERGTQKQQLLRKSETNRIKAIKQKAAALLSGKSNEKFKYEKYQGSKYY